MEQYKVHPRIVKNERCICIMILWRLTKVMTLQFNMNLILDKKMKTSSCWGVWESQIVAKQTLNISRWCYYKLKNNKCLYLQLSFTRCAFILFFIVKVLTKTSCFCCWFAGCIFFTLDVNKLYELELLDLEVFFFDIKYSQMPPYINLLD
jgi:hypothetical protein